MLASVITADDGYTIRCPRYSELIRANRVDTRLCDGERLKIQTGKHKMKYYNLKYKYKVIITTHRTWEIGVAPTAVFSLTVNEQTVPELTVVGDCQ